MKNKFYITTTLPYVNALPHIGHALEFIQADVISRYFKQKLGEENVWLNVGMDENGLKIYQKSQEEGKTPKEYADFYAGKWVEFCELFQVEFDTFYRTSEPYHIKPAQKFWKQSEENGDIYKKKYEGLYCVGCEEFKTEKELVDGKCPDHGKEPIQYSEENYFFKLSNYREKLLDWLDENPDVLKPKAKLEELKNWIKNMEDISISRQKENLPWGIDVPNDETQVMYVWFDALTNYVNTLGYGSEDNKSPLKKDQNGDFGEWWPGVQCFGPDNLRFQCAIWQGMLASAGLEQSNKLLCHGTVLGPDGTKMSKTKGNVISPFDQKDKFGIEAVRFYLISGISTYGNSAYKEDDLISSYNAHLANNFGNLLNRVIHLVNKYELDIIDVEENFKKEVDKFKSDTEKEFEDFNLQEAAIKINQLSTYGNEYITAEEPWSKEIVNEDREAILSNLYYLLEVLSKLYQPIIPDSAAKTLEMLENKEAGVLFEKIEK